MGGQNEVHHVRRTVQSSGVGLFIHQHQPPAVGCSNEQDIAIERANGGQLSLYNIHEYNISTVYI